MSLHESHATIRTDVIPGGRQHPQASGRLVELVAIGLLTEIIYLSFSVAYPLVGNTQNATTIFDLEKLTSDRPWLAGVYFGGVCLLFLLFWRALHLAQQIAAEVPHRTLLKLLMLGFGVLFAFTLAWLYPITANDLFRYVLRGRVWAVHGASPMLSPPNSFPSDPYILFAGEFGDWVSGYGPLWELLVQVPLRLGFTDMVPGAMSLKFLVLLFYVISAFLIGWIAWPAGKDAGKVAVSGLVIFAWNPMILLEGLGNGHNDMVLMALMILGVILWERKVWWGAAVALSLGALSKATGLLMLPLFGIALLAGEHSWGRRLARGAMILGIFMLLVLLLYSAVGPIAQTLRGVTDMLTLRRGYALASSLRVILREIVPAQIAEPIPRNTGRALFILFYAGLMLQLWRKKLNLTSAAFLAYFAQLMFGRTFRVWYPIWLIPLAALCPVSATFWRMFLFSLAGELYVLNTFLWRWWLMDWSWGQSGFLSAYWDKWTIINVMALPWFVLPLFGPIIIRWGQKLYAAQKAPTSWTSHSPGAA